MVAAAAPGRGGLRAPGRSRFRGRLGSSGRGGCAHRRRRRTVQGPICCLPKLLQRHIHRNVAFRFFGTGLSWLDGSERDFGSVKTLHRCKLQLPPTPEQPAYVCASSKGFLRISSGYVPMLLQFWMLLFLLLLFPTILAVAGLSGNYPQHVLGTAGLFVLPLMACVGFLHPVMAWLLRLQRTPLQEACREYLSELSPPSSATIAIEDQDHPKNQGLSIQALQHFWEHFKRFILDRTMQDHGQHRGATHRETADFPGRPRAREGCISLCVPQLGRSISAFRPALSSAYSAMQPSPGP